MKFRAIGANKETGARMTLEFEADSRAAAERKATQSGMSVNRVENMEGNFQSTEQPANRRKNKSVGFLILVILAVAFWWFFLRPRGFNLPAR